MSDRVTTLATCWRVTLTDATVLGFTDHDVDLTVSSQLYKSAVGYIPSAIQNTTELAPDNMDISGIIDDDGIKDSDLRAGKYDYASVLIFVVDYTDLGAGAVQTLVNGKLGSVSRKQGQFTAELNNLAYQLSTNIGEAYSTLCPADLGDARCGVTLTPVAMTVTGVTDKLTFADSARAEANGYFDGGLCTWATGNNAGYTMDIKTYLLSGGSFVLWEPMPFVIQVGDTATITRGCDKTVDTCRDTFSNIDNFRGHPHVPGVQKLLG